ncbi:hypothetical protein, partial [Chloroflexus sp.]|uniref:hypothetical protein n=1 Tax=Chloroflexus sp. TaxID=1904827 RepID=UPI002ADD4FAE
HPSGGGQEGGRFACSSPQRELCITYNWYHPRAYQPGMIAIGAVLGDWPGDSAPLQPCQHVLDGLPCPLVMRVSQRLACGSHAAAPAVLTIRGGSQQTPHRLEG